MIIITFSTIIAWIILATFRDGTVIPGVISKSTFIFLFTKKTRFIRFTTVAF